MKSDRIHCDVLPRVCLGGISCFLFQFISNAIDLFMKIAIISGRIVDSVVESFRFCFVVIFHIQI